MKRIAILFLSFFVALATFAQTQVPENSTSPIYFKGGKVGINTTNPSATLEVNGGIKQAGTSVNSFYGNLLMRLDSSGSSQIWFNGEQTDWSKMFSENISGTQTRLVLEVADDTNDYIQFRHRLHSGGGTTALMDLKIDQSIIYKPLGVGTTPATGHMLTVDGSILAKEVKVSVAAADWPDYVFADNYSLLSLPQLEAYINQHKHLPDMPSATEMEEQGLKMAEMNKLLLQKVEELTLYVIEQGKLMEEQMELVRKQQAEIEKLKAQLIK